MYVYLVYMYKGTYTQCLNRPVFLKFECQTKVKHQICFYQSIYDINQLKYDAKL